MQIMSRIKKKILKGSLNTSSNLNCKEIKAKLILGFTVTLLNVSPFY